MTSMAASACRELTVERQFFRSARESAFSTATLTTVAELKIQT